VDGDIDGDGSLNADDCDDYAADVYPGAAEVCANIGVDNDCDGNLNDATDFAPLWVDYDGDGFGDSSTSAVKSCAGENMVDNNGDCDDTNAAINPDAVEICDGGIDNDCDNLADDQAGSGVTDPSTWYEDADGDGAGDPAVSAVACLAPTGFVSNDTDGCPTVSTLQAPATWWRDQDIDGQGDPAQSTTACTQPDGYVGNDTDGCPQTQGVFAPRTLYRDADGDGYGDAGDTVSACTASGYVAVAGDECDDVYGLLAPLTWYADTDGDGFGDPAASTEACTQPTGYVGNNTDGCPDVNELQAAVTYYVDSDGDGYGSTVTESLCATPAPAGYSSNSDDCYDGNADLVTPIRYFGDADMDTFGDPAVFTDACSLTAPDGYVSNSDDECPTDGAKSDPGQCGCGNADTDTDGDGVADCVDTTPWLYLEAASSTFTDGYVTVNVELGSNQLGLLSTGAQMQLTYDTTKLTFVSAAPGSATTGAGLFSNEVFESVNAAAGTITYGVGVADGQAGSDAARRVAVLTFGLVGDAICGDSGLVAFAAGGSTFLSNQGGSAAINVTTSNLGAITAYSTSTGLMGVPSNSSRPADAGLAGAVIAAPSVTYVPVCGAGEETPVVTWSYSTASCGGAETDSGSDWPSLFRVGHTTVTWTAGGLTGSACYTVENYQVMELTVALDGVVAANSRTLEIASGGFTGTATQNLSGTATTVSVQVPVEAAGAYDCVSVKDAAHTLRSSATVSVTGTVYTASLVLEQGDSNDDNTVDILDFGMYVADFGTGVATNARSNFNGDASVNTTDFSFISINFFQVGSAGCTGAGGDGGLAGDGPMDRVSVAQLRKMGYGELAMADLNRDGWVDTADMALWMQGVRPEGDAGDASSGGNAAE
jgi:hypothetical protein